MEHLSALTKIQGGLIVSCQAFEGDPLYGPEMMIRMALAAKHGGAVGIRTNGAQDIRGIKQTTTLPVIGIKKCHYDRSDVYITPTIEDVEEVLQAGADIVAVDATNRRRPDGLTPAEFIRNIKQRCPGVLLMADVSVYEEGVIAVEAGADIVASTMSGYTDYSPQQTGPDFELIRRLVENVHVPVIAEGRIQCPEHARRCIEIGTWAVVVGSAITRPQEITRTFVESISSGNIQSIRASNS